MEKARLWDPKVVVELVSGNYQLEPSNESYADCIEGPARLGLYRAWRVWTYDKQIGQFQAHYAVAHRNDDLIFFRDFQEFSDFLSIQFDADKSFAIEERRHELRLAWVRTGSAVVIIFVFLGLVAFVGFNNPQAVSIAAIGSALVGAGIAFLLGPWTRRRVAESRDR